MLTPAVAATEVDRLHKRLVRQAAEVTKFAHYYEGKQPLMYSSLQWREWFGQQYEGFSDNWCQPVVDATAERQGLVGFRRFNEHKVDAELSRIFSVNGADADFTVAATEAQYARRAFMMVWPNPVDPETPFVTYESPSQVVIEQEPGARRHVRCALKAWSDPELGFELATLYTSTHLYKFQRRSYSTDPTQPQSTLILPSNLRALAGGWVPRDVPDEPWPLPNPLGEVPISELPNIGRLAGEPLSAIAGVMAMQDAVNLLWAHLFTASDFAAMPQRVILSADLPKIPILDKDGQKVGEKVIDLPESNVRRIINLDGPDAKIGQWDPADLKGFLEVIDRAIAHIIDQTRTPAYYFSSGNTIANINGDTIKALDAGLVQKVNRANRAMHDGLRRAASHVYKAKGELDTAAAIAAGTVVFANAEIRSEAQRADALSKYKELGMPFEWLVTQIVDDPDEVAGILEQAERERRDPTMERVARELGNELEFADQE